MRFFLSLASLLLLFASPLWAAVALDAVSTTTATNTFSQSYSVTTNGTNRLLVCAASYIQNGGNNAAATYNGTAMTNSGTVTNTAVETRLFSQVVTAPASGSAANVV